MLEIRDLHVHYGGIHAIKGISLQVPRGKIVTLIGANGGGQIQHPSVRGRAGEGSQGADPMGGRISSGGPRSASSGRGWPSGKGRRIFPQLTVQENLMLGAYIRCDVPGIRPPWTGYTSSSPAQGAVLAEGGTAGSTDARPGASPREQARHVIMMDEPSLGLAPLLVKEVFDIIETINGRGKTVLLVEQNAFAALKVAHYAYVLEVGQIVLEGPGRQLLDDPG